MCAGILMAFFYRFVAAAMDLENLETPTAGMMTPYSALFVFAVGIFVSNFFFNTLVMKKPFVGKPIAYSDYFSGNMKTHLVGILGGTIWALGTACSYIAAGKLVQLSPMLWDKVPLWLLPYGEYLSGKNSRAHLSQ